MLRTLAHPKCIVAPHDRRVWLWLDEPPSLFEWAEIEVALKRYMTEPGIETLVLAGFGWAAPQMSQMATQLHRDLRESGIAVEVDSETVPHLSLVDISARVPPHHARVPGGPPGEGGPSGSGRPRGAEPSGRAAERADHQE